MIFGETDNNMTAAAVCTKGSVAIILINIHLNF